RAGPLDFPPPPDPLRSAVSPTGPDPSPAARGAAQGRVPLVVCSAIALAALALRLHGIGWGLPEVFEEAYPFKAAWEMWGWGPQRGLDLNPHFFKYPSLTLYLQFLVQGILYVAMRAEIGRASCRESV